MSKHKNYSKKHVDWAKSATSVLSSTRLRVLAGATIIVVVVVCAYLPSISGGFIFDDNILLTENPIIGSSDGLYRFWCTTEALEYYPVSYASFWIEWRLWGMNPTGYHTINLILHIISSLLIWIVLRKLSIPGAFLAAIIFAVHPINVESIAWIAQRRNALSMLFFLLSIFWYLKGKNIVSAVKNIPEQAPGLNDYPLSPIPYPLYYWLSLTAFLLAMLSKGSTAVLPVLLLGVILWTRPLTRWDLVRTAPFFAVAVLLTAVNVWFQTHGSDIVLREADFLERLLGAGGVVWFYLYKAFLPLNLLFVYPQWHMETDRISWWLPLLAAVIVTAVLWLYRKTWGRPFLFAWGFFCVSLVPVMGFTDVGYMKHTLVADHYQHIAIIGAIALSAAGWSVWNRSARDSTRWRAAIVAIVAVGCLSCLTCRQNWIYSDAITLYKATLDKNPESWMAHYNLAHALIQLGQFQEAIPHYKQTLRLKSDDPRFYNNLGSALAHTGQAKEAIEYYRQALRLMPEYLEAQNNLGAALLNAGQFRDAIEQYEQTLRLKPDYPEALYNLGNALSQAGRPNEAIERYEQALRLKPDYFKARNNLGNELVRQGRSSEAIEHYEQVLRLTPENSGAHNNLGYALLNTGRLREAIEHFQKALLLKPDYFNAHYNLSNALVQAGRPNEAIEHFRQALALKPNNAEVYCDLALAYSEMHQSSEAVAAAQKALELAISQGQNEFAEKIEKWLDSYRSSLKPAER